MNRCLLTSLFFLGLMACSPSTPTENQDQKKADRQREQDSAENKRESVRDKKASDTSQSSKKKKSGAPVLGQKVGHYPPDKNCWDYGARGLPALSISLKGKTQFKLGEKISFVLTAKNGDKRPFTLIKANGKYLCIHGTWGCWTLRVRGPKGDFIPIPFPGFRHTARLKDVIELKPGESFSTTISLSQFIPAGQGMVTPARYLQRRPGKYELILKYDVPGKGVTFMAHGSAVGEVGRSKKVFVPNYTTLWATTKFTVK